MGPRDDPRHSGFLYGDRCPRACCPGFRRAFSRKRMTWSKPSFLWMMYCSRRGLKSNKQRRVLTVDITHDGFLWALGNAPLSRGPILDG